MCYIKSYKLFILVLLCGACTARVETRPTPDIDATLKVALEQTIAVQSTSTPTITQEPTTTPSSTPTLEKKPYTISIESSGWQKFSYEDLGFSISLPANWTYFDLITEDIDKMLESSVEMNPELLGIFSSDYLRSLAASGIKLYAVDKNVESLGSSIPSTLNVLAIESPMDITFDDYVEINIKQLHNMLGEDVDIIQNTIYLEEVEIALLEYEIVVNDIYGHAQIMGVQQYLIIFERMQYILTFGTIKGQFNEAKSVFDSIARSFELIR